MKSIEMIKTDILIIGAGNWFICRFEAFIKIKCHILDALPQVGGQLSELYPKNPSTIFLDFQSVSRLVGDN
jgi:thioredoxin reductase (NADPH)